jgi:hypothetical protein
VPPKTPILDTQVNEMSMMQAEMNLEAQTIGEVQPARNDRVGLGLPCANCRIYYRADLDACPVCRCRERVSATAFGGQWRLASTRTQ